MKIYLDVLFITNAVITLMYLKGLSKITHSKLKNSRIILASLFGGISSLILIIETHSFWQAALITTLKLAAVSAEILIAFGFGSIKKLFRYSILYIILNLIFAGCCLILWEITGSKIIYIKNYTVYFDISLLSIILSVILAYGAITVYDLITNRNFRKSHCYKAKYRIGDYEITLPAIADSGNLLCDSFTGCPVVVFYCNELFDHFNLDYENQFSLNGFRLIPCTTINGKCLLPVTSKGTVEVVDNNHFSKEIACYVGIARSGSNKSRAIFNPSLLM